MQEYGAYLQGDDDEAADRGRVSGPHPPRAPLSLGVPNQRAGRGAGWAARCPLSAHHLNFGASSSAAGSRGGQDDVVPSWPTHSGGNSGLFISGLAAVASGGGRGYANSSSVAPGRHRASSNSSNCGGTHGRGGRGGRAARSAGPLQAPGGGYTDVDDEGAWEEVEYGSSGVPPMSNGSRANWSDRNNGYLLALCLEQVRAGHYNGCQMSGEGYQAIADGYFAKTGLLHTRLQLKNQIAILKSTYSFWCYLQIHTGLGRNPDGSVDADSEYWKPHLEMGQGEDDDGGSTSSSEDEIISMCRKNLKMAQNFVAQMVPIFGMYSDNYFVKLPRRQDGESGLQWVQRTLRRDNSCYKMFRVERPLFNRLHNTLVESYGLQSTSQMTSIEALAMFLWIVGAPQPIRQAEDRFRRSMETISRTFNSVLTSILRLAHHMIKPRDPDFTEVHPTLDNPNFWPHFKNCIGAIDGTHVKLVVGKSKRIQYLNRNNETSQNVLAVCDFDMRFTFVLSGWPGSVHDMRVFKDAMTTYGHKFPHPPPGSREVLYG
ncbi:uncharacterized protein LOC120712503 isoform X2 [Panicum virgatum]|uniref:uncharacterized protein LOC120712503 isoform X2 n=1 Tax=Panicum virgatum TaxID=38727 RepID=UPI0019D5A643|nr:uncharacterized protein LOC120712503 isoform X2 [Panicum virgatum]